MKTVDEIVTTFVNIDPKATRREAVDAVLTPQEIDVLKTVPRDVPMSGPNKSQFPVLKDTHGKARTMFPFLCCMTDEEKAMYYGGTSQNATAAETVFKYLKTIKTEIVPDEVWTAINTLMPKSKAKGPNTAPLYELFGVHDLDILTGPVNITYLMMRGPNNEFSQSLTPTFMELAQLGYMPKYTAAQVESLLTKLEKKGFDVRKHIA